MPLTGKYNNRDTNKLGHGMSFQRRTELLSIDACSVVEKVFFSGACLICGAMHSEPGVTLLRCGGCKLVSYCSKDCQISDWKNHKVLCKKFPSLNGKNAIERNTESERDKDPPSTLHCGKVFIYHKCWGKYMDIIHGMQQLSIDIISKQPQMRCQPSGLALHYGVEHIFEWPRVCNFCHLAVQEKLFDCRCCAVSYCGEDHRMKDEFHSNFNKSNLPGYSSECNRLYGCAMANRYLIKHRKLQIPDGLLNEANLNECIEFEKVSKLPQYSNEEWLETIVNLVNERLGYPLTIHHALKNLKIGKLKQDLHDITNLTIHIVHSTPMLDPRFWEFFMHQLPNLKTLNLTFISGYMRLYTRYNTYMPAESCSDCFRKQRVITCDLHSKYYHEYFASDDYEEPDVVVVFDTDNERYYDMKDFEKTHKFISLGNMAFNKDTVVILSDCVRSHLEACLKIFKKNKPVKVLKEIQENPVCGFSTLRGLHFIVNVRRFICCIQKKK